MTQVVRAPISVVVPTYNDARRLVRLFASLDALDPAPEEVVVVDDGSSDDTPSLLSEWSSAPRRFSAVARRLESNGGPARARNDGLTSVTQPLVAFTDSDCEVTPNWLGAYTGFFANASDGLAGAGGRVLTRDRHLVGRYMETNRILEPWPQDDRPVLYLVTANACFRRESLLAAGGFDERIPIAGGEDPGVCFKLLRAGFRLGFCPSAVVRHDFRSDIWSFMKMFHRYGRGCRYVSDRYLPSREHPLASPVSSIPAGGSR